MSKRSAILKRQHVVTAGEVRHREVHEIKKGDIVPEGIVVATYSEAREYETPAGVFQVPTYQKVAVIGRVSDEMLDQTAQAVRHQRAVRV